MKDFVSYGVLSFAIIVVSLAAVLFVVTLP